MIEFCQTPIDKTKLPHISTCPSMTMRSTHLSILVIDHNVMRLNISVHDTFAMAEVESLYSVSHITKISSCEYAYLEELEYVIPDIVVHEFGVKTSEIGVVDVFEDQTRRFTLH
jgi:hypothetical protein